MSPPSILIVGEGVRAERLLAEFLALGAVADCIGGGGVAIREGLLAGRHVLIDAPLDGPPEALADLFRLAAERNRILMPVPCLLDHPATEALAALCSNRLGSIRYISAHRLDPGVLAPEAAAEDLALILGLLKEEPAAVSVATRALIPPPQRDGPDVAAIDLCFRSQRAVHLHLSRLHPCSERRLTLYAENGEAVLETGSTASAGRLRLFASDGTGEETVPFEPADAGLKACRRFLQCLSTGGIPPGNGEDGLRLARVMHALKQSWHAGAPVELVRGGQLRNADIHPTAVIDTPATIGAGTCIWHFSHVMPDSRIGRNCKIGQNVLIGSGVSIGDGCKIQNNVSVYPGVTLEEEVFCGPSCVFTNVAIPRAAIDRRHAFLPTLVRRGATIGANATIVCGHTIGRHAFIGAGAVVTRDVPDHALAVGNPARIIGFACRCGVRLPKGEWGETVCPACGVRFRRAGGQVTEVPP